MNILRYVGKYIFEFLPLLIFLQLADRQGNAERVNWLFAFEIAAVAAFFHIVYLISRKFVANRVALGIDFYFLFGGIASFFHFSPALALLRDSREFGMLVSIFLIGIVTTFFSPYGFVGYQNCVGKIYTYSIYLLVVAFFCTALSFVYMGNPMLAGVVPVFLIIITNRLLLRKLQNFPYESLI